MTLFDQDSISLCEHSFLTCERSVLFYFYVLCIKLLYNQMTKKHEAYSVIHRFLSV